MQHAANPTDRNPFPFRPPSTLSMGRCQFSYKAFGLSSLLLNAFIRKYELQYRIYDWLRFFTHLVSVWQKLFLLTYFTIELIFAIIHESYYTISTKFYIYLQYFQQKSFQFQQNKRIPNRHLASSIFHMVYILWKEKI